jgi:hypothetical protein
MDYFGPMVNRSARVEGIAQGGQILMSSSVWDSIQSSLQDLGNPEIADLGEFQLKGLDTKTHILQMLPRNLTARKFPVASKPESQEDKPKFKGLEEELAKLQKENMQLNQQLGKIANLLEEANTKVKEFVVVLQKSSGEG